MLKSRFTFVYENFNTTEVLVYDSLRALANTEEQKHQNDPYAKQLKYSALWFAFSEKKGKNPECFKYTCNDFRVVKTLRYFTTKDQSQNSGKYRK